MIYGASSEYQRFYRRYDNILMWCEVICKKDKRNLHLEKKVITNKIKNVFFYSRCSLQKVNIFITYSIRIVYNKYIKELSYMEKFNGFKNSWILSEDGLLKTDLVVKFPRFLLF